MSVRSAVHQTSVASKRKTSVLPNRRKKLSKMRSGKLRRFLIFINDFDVCCVWCVVCCVLCVVCCVCVLCVPARPNRTGRSPASCMLSGSMESLYTQHSTLCLPTCAGCKMLCILDDIPQNLPLSLISYISQ